MKRCWGCDQDLPTEAFHADKGKKDGLQSKCKACQYARYQERLAENPDKVRAVARRSQQKNRRRQLYGITNDEFDAMIADQDGVCAICGRVPPPRQGTHGGFVVDHDHDTGLVRGALCHNCNRAIGLLRDDATTLARAAEYLERHDRPAQRPLR